MVFVFHLTVVNEIGDVDDEDEEFDDDSQSSAGRFEGM